LGLRSKEELNSKPVSLEKAIAKKKTTGRGYSFGEVRGTDEARSGVKEVKGK